MMNLYRRNNNHGTGRLIAATIIVVLVFAFDLLSGGTVRGVVQNATAGISTMSARLFYNLKYSGLFSTRATLAAQNQTLQSQVARYQEQAAAYQALKQENAQLAAMAHLAQKAPGITAPIVSSSHSSPYGTFLIGAGEAERITQNDLVLTGEGFVVGRVTRVNAHTALVSAILAPSATLDTIVAETSTSFTGTGGGNARAQIPRGITISVGDIVTSRTDGGRPIGVVGKVESDPASAYSTVYMRLPTNISSLQFVYVLAAAH